MTTKWLRCHSITTSELARAVSLTLVDQPLQCTSSLANRKVGHVVVVFCDVDEPFAFDVTDSPDIVLGREDKFLIQCPARQASVKITRSRPTSTSLQSSAALCTMRTLDVIQYWQRLVPEDNWTRARSS